MTIRLFESELAPTPMLTVTMDNATFDTQINRIYTDAATIDRPQKSPPTSIPVNTRRGMRISTARDCKSAGTNSNASCNYCKLIMANS